MLFPWRYILPEQQGEKHCEWEWEQSRHLWMGRIRWIEQDIRRSLRGNPGFLLRNNRFTLRMKRRCRQAFLIVPYPGPVVWSRRDSWPGYRVKEQAPIGSVTLIASSQACAPEHDIRDVNLSLALRIAGVRMSASQSIVSILHWKPKFGGWGYSTSPYETPGMNLV